MKVLFVCSVFYSTGNGLSASARTTTKYLKEAGLDVKVLSMKNTDPEGPQPEFSLEVFHFPIFQPLIEAHGYCFAKRDKKIIKAALEWADVVHIEEAFVLEIQVAKMATEMGVPCVGTYHLHPENIFCSIGMGKWRGINGALMKIFRNAVYDKCSDVQCPTQNVLDRLRKFNYKARLHLIPNGAILKDETVELKEPEKNPYLLLCIGRLSNEKDQYTLMRAMKYSKHAQNIQLYFAGAGPKEKSMKRAAAALKEKGILKYAPEFGFHDREQLDNLSSRAYLYIHCATVEVEGLSCIEALEQGAVPVIAEGELTATSQFALCPESLFPAGDEKALAERIDWWIEHEEYRKEMGFKYLESVKQYDIKYSIAALIEMYKTAIEKK